MKRHTHIRLRLYAVGISLLVLGGTALVFQNELFRYVQQLANPNARSINITEGLRKEQIAERFAKALQWTPEDVQQFLTIRSATANTLAIRDGFYFPDTYIVDKDASVTDVAATLATTFDTEIIATYFDGKNASIKDPATVLKIASIIQRESGGKSDMRLISGILWNRLLKGMRLQTDATIQYAKGSSENGWWPHVSGKDIKTIQSAYNTYKINGLPPSPIANAGVAAIEAALNPLKTTCLYYIHDTRGTIHCSPTYRGHEQNIRAYLK